MKIVIVSGYKALFGQPKISYEEVLANVSSQELLLLLSVINNELNSVDDEIENQNRLLEILMKDFNQEETKIAEHIKTKTIFLFAKRYLLSMLIKEGRINRMPDKVINPSRLGYKFLIAYLLHIDEVNDFDSFLLDQSKKISDDEMPMLPLLWAFHIKQYGFNHSANGAYELFMLNSFCIYILDKYGDYLRKLLALNKVKNISEFISGYVQILQGTQLETKGKIFKKLVFNVPKSNSDFESLKSQAFNQLLGKIDISIKDIKKYPLIEVDNKFAVIDNDFYKKKIYKGPLFDLFYKTSIQEVKKFEDFKNDLSKNCIEKKCFRTIISLIGKTSNDVLMFDEGLESYPDAYYRHNKRIIIIEFKDYIFSDEMINNNNYEDFKLYVKNRFESNSNNKAKGVSQIIKQINCLINSKNHNDLELKNFIHSNKRIEVYPIICHTDFMFSMPGVDDYLNTIFYKNKPEHQNFKINNVSFMNLETLFDFALRGGSFIELMSFIDRYWKNKNEKAKQMNKGFSIENYLSSMKGFDEAYRCLYRNFSSKRDDDLISKLFNLAGIEQSAIDKIIT